MTNEQITTGGKTSTRADMVVSDSGKNVKVVNLTPHAIVIDGVGEIPPTPPPARCEEKIETVGHIFVNGTAVPIIRKTLGNIQNLPPPHEGTIYIVSLPVAQAVSQARKDVFAIGESVRNEKGQIVGAKSIATFG